MTTIIDMGRAARSLPFARFLVTGVLNTLFGYVIFLLGLFFEAPPEVALGMATILGSVFNYFTTARFVFAHRAVNRLPSFLAAYGFIYVVNGLAIRLLAQLGLHPGFAQALLTPAIAVMSFLVFRSFVFRPVPSA